MLVDVLFLQENYVSITFSCHQVLADVIRKYHRHHHLLDMLTEVNKQVAAIANDYPQRDLSFQVPAQSHTLRAKVFL